MLEWSVQEAALLVRHQPPANHLRITALCMLRTEKSCSVPLPAHGVARAGSDIASLLTADLPVAMRCHAAVPASYQPHLSHALPFEAALPFQKLN